MKGKSLTTEQFKEKVYNKHGKKVEILGEYIKSTIPISFVYHCDVHGDTIKSINAKNILMNCFQPCKLCNSIIMSNKQSSQDKNVNYNRLLTYVNVKGGVLYTEKWDKAKSIYEIHCGNPEHPHFFSNADKLLNSKQWCPYCCGRKGDFEKEIEKIINDKNGKLLTSYNNSNTHVKVLCNTHNYKWDVLPLNIKKGRWCPVCNLPYSEKVAYDYLVHNDFKIRVQYKFNDLAGENNELLKFDFGIVDENENLLGLIEVDDSEHYFNTKHDRRIKARLRDKRKDEYCNLNNIKLFRLKYENNNDNFQDYNWYYEYIHKNLINYLNIIKNQNINNILDRSCCDEFVESGTCV